MGNRWRTPLRAMLAAVVLLAGAAEVRARDGLVLRAVGFFQGEAADQGQCTVPTIDSGIVDNTLDIGLLNTFGVPTVSFPQPGINGCGGWIELQNMMTFQGISIDYVDIRLRIAGAGRFRQFVPTRNGFPTACRSLRHSRLFTGIHLFPMGTPNDVGNTAGGVPHLAFVQLNPMVSAQIMRCLQQQYVTLPADVYSSFPLVIRAVGVGTADDGSTYKTNAISYTVTLNHLCGNGRLDFGEICDPNAPNTCIAGACDLDSFTCTGNKDLPCTTNADCVGTCLPQGDPMECNCVF